MQVLWPIYTLLLILSAAVIWLVYRLTCARLALQRLHSLPPQACRVAARPDEVSGAATQAGARTDAPTRREEDVSCSDYFIHSPVLLCCFDAEARLLQVNPAWQLVTGHPAVALRGHTLFELVHPADLERALAWIDEIKAGIISTREMRFRYCDGAYRWLAWQARQHDQVLYAVARDVTRQVAEMQGLQRKQRIFEAFHDASPACVFIKDDERRYLYVNRTQVETFGLGERNWQGHTFEQLFPGREAEEMHKTDERMLASLRPIQTEEAVSVAGEPRIYSLKKFPIVIEDEVLLGGIALDITTSKRQQADLENVRQQLERRVAEKARGLERSRQALMNLADDLTETGRQLQRANEHLKELDRLKSLFIASVSHELRSPLNTIIGFASILVKKAESSYDEQTQRQLDTILVAARHLLTLINDILDLSRIEAGKLVAHYETFRLDDVVDEVLRLTERAALEKQLEMRHEVPPLEIHSDRQRLVQCLLNLVGNAIKFTSTGYVEVMAKQLGADTGVVELSVSDSGPGIAATEMTQLFEPFGRLKRTSADDPAGLGLGLFLTRRLVEDILSGEIDVVSTPGSGSLFRMRIPAYLERHDVPSQQE